MITILSRNGEAEILDKQILVKDLDDLFIAQDIDGDDLFTAGNFAEGQPEASKWLYNKTMFKLVSEARANEREEGLDMVDDEPFLADEE